MKRPERAVVLLKPQFIGDAVMACPLLDSIAAEYEYGIVVCGPLVQRVLADRKDRLRFEMGEKITGFGPVFRAAKQLRRLRVNHAYLVNRSFRSALAAKLAGIPVRIGHNTEGRGLLLSRSVPYEKAKFEAECYLDLARTMDVPPIARKPKLDVTEAERKIGEAKLEGAVVGIQPGARYPDKQVPLPIMAAAAEALRTESIELALLGGLDEVASVARFQDLLKAPAVDLIGKLEIRETMGALANLKVMVGNDTGLMHLAAAVGCPTATVFGPNPAMKWAHRYPPHQFVQAPGMDIKRVEPPMIVKAAMAALEDQPRPVIEEIS